MQLSTPEPVAQVLVGYAHQSSVLFLFTDTSGTLYSNVHVTDVVTQIPNIKVSKARAGVDRTGLLHFYGTDAQGQAVGAAPDRLGHERAGMGARAFRWTRAWRCRPSAATRGTWVPSSPWARTARCVSCPRIR